MRLNVLLAFILLFGIYTSAFAQENKYQFSHLDISNGLSHNQVNCIYKDAQGFMWFGTLSGLNRYDGYTFKVFKHNVNDSTSINDDYIVNIFEGPSHNLWIETRNGFCIYNPQTEQFNSNIAPVLKSLKLPGVAVRKIKKDSRGDFWFLYDGSGIYRYNETSQQIYHYTHSNNSPVLLYANNVVDFAEDNKGNLWFAYDTGVIEMMNSKLNKISYRKLIVPANNSNKKRVYAITVDSDNDIWFYAPTINMGLYYLDPEANTIKYIDKETTETGLNTNIVNNIVQADDGLIWIGTDHGGINVLNKKNFKVNYLLNREDDTKSLVQNSVILYKDNAGIMWAGTFKEGISYYHKNIIRFPLYRHFASDPGSLSFEDVDKFVEDKEGNLWIGTNGGGLIYFNRKTGKYTQYKHNVRNNNSLSNDIIVSLCIDHNQKLWIGTYFGGMDGFDGKTFTHYRHDDNVATSVSDDRIYSIIEDSSHRLWVGTFAGGLNLFDPITKFFSRPFTQAQIQSPYISSIFEDKDGNIWVGGYMGINVILKQSGRVIHYVHDTRTSNSLIADNVNSITQDSRGLMWIATRDGLSILNTKTKRFTSLVKEDGLPDNSILNILEDNDHMMWLSTSGGLCRIALKPVNKKYSFRFKNFDESDGLQAREFNVNAALKTQKGELIFGGGHGFNIFDPQNIQTNTNKPKLIFTDLQLLNNSVAANEAINGHVILSKAISATHSISLNHAENVFTIEFAALNFFNPNKVKYQYMLEGFDKSWLTAYNNVRKATYTNLDGGNYVFKVRASNADGLWDNNVISLNIKVNPPFWKSSLAYAFYVLIVAGGLLFIRHRGIQKIRKQFIAEQEKKEIQLIIEQERQEIERMHEIDKLKTKFLTNVSHEFRTPLSLIMAPVDKMLHHAANADQKLQLNMISKNARRLLNLVNQLLDFRKMEVHELKLHTKPGDIVNFIKEASLSFTDIADQKGIGFLFDTDVDTFKTSFDHDKIERILFNLLSNAFKFTPAGGHVSVLLNMMACDGANELKFIEIKVMDTGIGIPKDKQECIFERFFQNNLPGSMLNQGSGIGLAITKEFVYMHQGKISVESEPEHGSCFIVHLPVPALDDLEISLDDTENEPHTENVDPFKVQKSGKKPTLLLVEDNDDFRFYLKDNMKDMFHIIEASNGKEGWQKALALHPDIMVSDISMPEMNGKELCRKIKNDSRTSHIPIILLTALIGEEEELKGLEIGANDYMTKPFNFEILISKIKNLLNLQATFKKTYTRQLDIQINEPAIASVDEKFVKEIVTYIGENMLNPALSVNELSRHMGMNRNTLYKKLLTITGKSPVEYIRLLRLRKAAHLLEYSRMNIAEVSYEVGFNTPQYFAKSFKDEFNMLPSEFVLQKRGLHQEKINIS
ncbi:Signal transduction histidine kinase [Mucilaginibacter pineti]|uniref:histidine kinase n=1 Tax=Mucilaginibacter pineti TaxID=1391627 RepID=A0A1G6U523_9SPHI|nr:hybrid sensor histidine kinase/response regulator transcription factor [Mucilaginibacter pineti]SDD36381.1 Signal transduction histidine kinase [Mucilaginibacter pineti]